MPPIRSGQVRRRWRGQGYKAPSRNRSNGAPPDPKRRRSGTQTPDAPSSVVSQQASHALTFDPSNSPVVSTNGPSQHSASASPVSSSPPPVILANGSSHSPASASPVGPAQPPAIPAVGLATASQVRSGHPPDSGRSRERQERGSPGLPMETEAPRSLSGPSATPIPTSGNEPDPDPDSDESEDEGENGPEGEDDDLDASAPYGRFPRFYLFR